MDFFDQIAKAMEVTIARMKACGLDTEKSKLLVEEGELGISGAISNTRDIVLTIGGVRTANGSVREYINICHALSESDSASLSVSRDITHESWKMEFEKVGVWDGQIIRLAKRCGMDSLQEEYQILDEDMERVFREIVETYMY